MTAFYAWFGTQNVFGQFAVMGCIVVAICALVMLFSIGLSAVLK